MDLSIKYSLHSFPELEFAIFCIENVATKLQIPGNEVYGLLTKYDNLLYHYIIPSYDVLHTQSKEYIVEDIIVCMKEKRLIS